MKSIIESIIGRKGDTFAGKSALQEYDIAMLRKYGPIPRIHFVIFDKEIIEFLVSHFEKDPAVIADRIELAKDGILVCDSGYEYLDNYNEDLIADSTNVIAEVYRSHNRSIFHNIKNEILSKYFVPVKWINKIWKTYYNKIWERK